MARREVRLDDRQVEQQYIRNPRIGKGKQLVGLLLIVVAVIVFVSGSGGENSAASSAGVVIFLVGAIIGLVGRFQHWWHWR